MLESIRKIQQDKKEYKQMMGRVEQLPHEYQFVFKKMQDYLWRHGALGGQDVLPTQHCLTQQFESAAAEGLAVLDVTGEDVAAFCDALLEPRSTYDAKQRQSLNRAIKLEVGRQERGGK